jgi:hypothetical protein
MHHKLRRVYVFIIILCLIILVFSIPYRPQNVALFLFVYVFFGRYDSHDQGMNYMLYVVAYMYLKICLPNFYYHTIVLDKPKQGQAYLAIGYH